MRLGLLFLGVILLAVGWRGTYSDFFSRLSSDIPGFITWVFALLAIGAIGYVPELAAMSNGLLVLVFLVIFISNEGVFAQWQQLAQHGVPAAATTPLVPTADQPALNQNPTINFNLTSGPSSADSGTSTALGAVKTAASFIPIAGALISA